MQLGSRTGWGLKVLVLMVPNPRKELFLNQPGEKRKKSQSEQRKQACFGMAA